MKRLGWILVLALAAAPGWCAGAKKITIAELKDTLTSMQAGKKTDTEVAAALKQVELTEQLTRTTMNSLVSYVPGPLSTEQIYVLEARSALLPPPAAESPAAAAPDAAADKAILDKAADYINKTYNQLPALTATKTTIRFQDNVEAASGGSGMQGGASEVTTGSGFVNAFQFVHYINSTDSTVALEHGAEKASTEKDKTPWGSNRMIALQMPALGLGEAFAEAQGAGEIKFARWETINGKQAAVYTFNVPKKKAHYEVNVCCFPEVQSAGKATFSSAALPGGGGASGNFQTATSWHNYKNTAPYHGEFFIDPETGAVVRLVIQAELKQSDVVHQVDTRTDFGPVMAGGKTLVLPARSITLTEVVPNGDSGSAGAFSLRHTYFTAEYKDYKAGTN